MSGEKLEPCPFCGAEPKGTVWDSDSHTARAFCTKCDVLGPREDSHERAAEAWNTRASGWQPIESAPKDGTEVLLYGRLSHLPDSVHIASKRRVSGYFDPVDEWCVTTASAMGPFVDPELWMPLPPTPQGEG